jgi:uncharacterized membrane protein (UPF0136 family)
MARWIVLGYGILNIIGGVIGFAMAGSMGSLIAGGLAGLLLVGCSFMAATKPGMAFRTAGGICVLLIGFWIYRINEVMQAGGKLMMPAGNLGIAIIVLVSLLALHLRATKKAAAQGAGH